MLTHAAKPWSTTAAAMVRAVSSLPQVVNIVTALIMGNQDSGPVRGLNVEFAMGLDACPRELSLK